MAPIWTDRLWTRSPRPTTGTACSSRLASGWARLTGRPARALRAGSPGDDFPLYVFGARRLLRVGDATYQMLALSVLDEFGDPGRLPYSIKVVLENVVPQAAGSRGER